MQSAQNAFDGLADKVSELKKSFFKKVSKEYLAKFFKAINDDLNMPKAMAIVFELLRSDLTDGVKYAMILRFDEMLGFGFKNIKPLKIPTEIKKLAKKRQDARARKDFALADKIRQEIEQKGYLIEDMPQGPRIKHKF